MFLFMQTLMHSIDCKNFFDQLNFNKLKITHLILKETLLIKSVFIIILENPSTLFSVVKL